MKHSVPFQFKQMSKESEGGAKLYTAIASTDALDRDREVLLPKGCVTENFLKNPVMLHIHDYQHVPVGKVHNIRIEDAQIEFDFEFADTDTGKEMEAMYQKGYMSAFSVGLYPLKSVWIDDETPKKMELEVAGGEKQMFDLEKYTIPPRRVVNLWELLEISPVPVPSNPEALIQRATENVVRKFIGDGDHSDAEKMLLQGQLSEKLDDMLGNLKTFMDALDGTELQKSVPVHITPIKTDDSWDGTLARAKLAKWASKGGTGKKEDLDWGKFAKGFGWVDLSKADNFTAYKYPHHTIEDGSLVASWSGVTIAMAALLGKHAGSSLSEEDRKAVYDHLAQHYKTADKEAPEFDKEYTEEELKAIEEGTYVTKKDDDTTDEPETTSDTTDQGDPKSSSEYTDVIAAVKSVVGEEVKVALESILPVLEEMNETLRIRMNILTDTMEEVQRSLNGDTTQASTSTEGETADDDDPDDDKGAAQAFSSLNDLLKGLPSLNS